MSEHEKRLRESLGQSMLHHLEMLLAEKAEEISRARAEALEEVAKTAERRSTMARQVYRNHPLEQQGVGAADALATLAADIRVDITTPAPATIPVEKVRAVLLSASAMLNRQGYGSGIIRDIATDLGVDLDGKAADSCLVCGETGPHKMSCRATERAAAIARRDYQCGGCTHRHHAPGDCLGSDGRCGCRWVP